jgi:maltose O-acetyltransferase
MSLAAIGHPLEAGPRREKWEAAEPITIGDKVWLAVGVPARVVRELP